MVSRKTDFQQIELRTGGSRDCFILDPKAAPAGLGRFLAMTGLVRVAMTGLVRVVVKRLSLSLRDEKRSEAISSTSMIKLYRH
jgi:hypothetical protein